MNIYILEFYTTAEAAVPGTMQTVTYLPQLSTAHRASRASMDAVKSSYQNWLNCYTTANVYCTNNQVCILH